MFESLIASGSTTSQPTEGRLSQGRIREIAAQEGFLGGMFKSKEEKIAAIKRDALAKLDHDVHEVKEWMDRDVASATTRIMDYLADVKTIAEGIRGAKFNKAKFDALTVAHTTPKFHVMEAALFHTSDVHKYLDLVLAWLTDQGSANPYDEHNNIHDHNPAYLSFDGHIETPFDYLSGGSEIDYYAIESGAPLKAAGYPDNYVNHMTTSTNQVVDGIRSFINKQSYLTHVESYARSVINKPNESPKDYHNKVNACVQGYKDMAYTLGGSIRSSSWYLHKAVYVVHLIAKHCYE